MKKLLTYLTLFILLFSTPSFAKNWIMPAYDGTTGGTAGKLDAIDVCSADGAGYDVQDKDAALVWDQAGNRYMLYIYDIDSAAAESDPDIIAPDNCDAVPYAGDGRWIRASAHNTYEVGDEATILDVADSVTAGDSYPTISDNADDDTPDELFAAIDAWAAARITATDTLADFTDDIDATLRYCQGQTFQTFGAEDATPDVSNGGSTVVQCWRTAGTPTITAFDDGDDTSEFADGDTVFVLFNSAAVFTITDSASFKGHGNNDYTGAAGEGGWFTWDATNNYWVVKFSETKSANFTTLRVPNDESADGALANLGEVHMRGDEDTLNLHAGAGGEVAGEVSVSMLQHVAIPIDFTYVYDRDTAHRLPLFVVNSKVYPNGITIDYISVKHIGNRTTALDADLKRATDFQGTSTAVILALDVADTADEMAQDTDASINGGAVVAAGQHIYIEVSADPVDEDNLATVEIIFHAEAD